MRGNLIKIDDLWMVAYLNNEGYHLIMLHPEDAKYIFYERYVDDIEFKIVSEKQESLNYTYAKIITQ
jgi:hypothetical protein